MALSMHICISKLYVHQSLSIARRSHVNILHSQSFHATVFPKESTYNAVFVRKIYPIFTSNLCLARSNQSSVLVGPLVDPVNNSLVIARVAIITLELKRRGSASRDVLQVEGVSGGVEARGAGVAISVGNAGADLDLRD